jgi:hypothetical protein
MLRSPAQKSNLFSFTGIWVMPWKLILTGLIVMILFPSFFISLSAA